MNNINFPSKSDSVQTLLGLRLGQRVWIEFESVAAAPIAKAFMDAAETAGASSVRLSDRSERYYNSKGFKTLPRSKMLALFQQLAERDVSAIKRTDIYIRLFDEGRAKNKIPADVAGLYYKTVSIPVELELARMECSSRVLSAQKNAFARASGMSVYLMDRFYMKICRRHALEPVGPRR